MCSHMSARLIEGSQTLFPCTTGPRRGGISTAATRGSTVRTSWTRERACMEGNDVLAGGRADSFPSHQLAELPSCPPLVSWDFHPVFCRETPPAHSKRFVEQHAVLARKADVTPRVSSCEGQLLHSECPAGWLACEYRALHDCCRCLAGNNDARPRLPRAGIREALGMPRSANCIITSDREFHA